MILQMRIRDLLDALGDTAAVATERHSPERAVRWVHVTDVPEPGRYLRGGELVLTNGLWHRSREDVERFVRALAEAGAPALGFPLHEGQPLPPGLVAECERHAILLLVLPDIPFQDIAELVTMQLAEERREAHRLARPLAEELRLARDSGKGPDALVRILERVAGAPMLLLLRDGRRYGEWAPEPALLPRIWERAFGGSSPSRRPVGLRLPGGREITIAPVTDGATGARADPVPAVLLLDAPPETFPADGGALSRVAAEFLPLAELRASEEHAVARISALLRDGRAGADAAALERRLSGLDPGFAERAAAGRLVAIAAGGADTEVLAGAVRVTLPEAAACVGAVSGPRSTAIALLAGPTPPAEQLAQRLAACLGAVAPGTALGLAAPEDPSLPLRLLVALATDALRAAEREPSRRWALAAAAGSHRLLLETAGDDALEALQRGTIEPLRSYDRLHGSELLRSLRVFLERCGSWRDSAAELHLHVNSLRYRIARIEQLTGRSLASMADRTDFFLALQAEERAAGSAAGNDEPGRPAGDGATAR